MQELQVSFSGKYSTYAQIARQGNIVLYRRFPRASGNVCHEVAVVRIMPAHVSPAGFDIDDKEVYPKEDELDTGLWRYDSLRDAEQQFRRLVTRAAQPATAQVVHAGLQEGAGESGSD